jgi:hypothetical protein
MPVSGNFTVLDSFPKLFIVQNIWKDSADQDCVVSENFTVL